MLNININKHNKKQIPLLNLVNNCISAKSEPQMLSIKGECTFHFSNFLVIGLCNSSANSLFCIVLFLTAPHTLFYQKNYKPPKQVHVDICHVLDF